MVLVQKTISCSAHYHPETLPLLHALHLYLTLDDDTWLLTCSIHLLRVSSVFRHRSHQVILIIATPLVSRCLRRTRVGLGSTALVGMFSAIIALVVWFAVKDGTEGGDTSAGYG